MTDGRGPECERGGQKSPQPENDSFLIRSEKTNPIYSHTWLGDPGLRGPPSPVEGERDAQSPCRRERGLPKGPASVMGRDSAAGHQPHAGYLRADELEGLPTALFWRSASSSPRKHVIVPVAEGAVFLLDCLDDAGVGDAGPPLSCGCG